MSFHKAKTVPSIPQLADACMRAAKCETAGATAHDASSIAHALLPFMVALEVQLELARRVLLAKKVG
jgi:hypothetical protein